MDLSRRKYENESDYWRIRQFLREVFLLNGRREHSWHVARWDYFRWHFITNLQVCGPLEQVASIWETADGQIAAVLHPVDPREAFLHVHPAFRTPELEEEMIAHAEEHIPIPGRDGMRRLYFPVDRDDPLRQKLLLSRGYVDIHNPGHKYHRDLEAPLPHVPLAAGYTLRSMGGLEEHPARNWASWQAFHSDEPDQNYDQDWSWYANLQSAPLYRRDLDIVAVTEAGEIASFCTIYYDDDTRSAVCVLVGTAAGHQRRGLGKAVMFEGLRRLQRLGCTRVLANAYDPPADALYGSVLNAKETSQTFLKEYRP
jgi:GNAT superfamily N-acetyltransferase